MRLVHPAAAIVCILLASIALLHFYWATGGAIGVHAALPSVHEKPVFRPSPASTAAVGICLLLAAALVAATGGLLGSIPLSPRLLRYGTTLLAAVFALRAIGDFHFFGLFKIVRGTKDSYLYTPLCLLLSALIFFIALRTPAEP